MVEYRHNEKWTAIYIDVEFISDFRKEIEKYGNLEIVDIQWFRRNLFERIFLQKTKWNAICMVSLKD